MLKSLIFNFLILSAPASAFAAACCGGGFALPALITGDSKAQLTTSYSYSKIDTDVFADGIWQKRATEDGTAIYKIEGAHIFADRFQAGITLPIYNRSVSGLQGGSSTGLGDVTGQLGFEFLPEWNYSSWRPHGIGFISMTFPTGKSVYESETGLDSRGRGFFALGIGSTFTKTWVRWDANATFEVHKSFEKSLSNSQNTGTIRPGFGNSASIGAGYNIGDLRLGSSLSWYYEDPIHVRGTITSTGTEQRYAAATIMANYLFSDSWAGAVSYSDQTLIGEPINASLAKTVQVSLQKLWPR